MKNEQNELNEHEQIPMTHNGLGCNGTYVKSNYKPKQQYNLNEGVRIKENPIGQTIVVALAIVGLMGFILVMLCSF